MADELIIPTKERVGSYDAIETAKKGEPLFPLQGGDPFAPATILYWAELARSAGLSEVNPAKAERLLKKASAAEIVAWSFQAYQDGQVDDDEPEPVVEIGPITDRIVILSRGADRLNNALAETYDVADAIETLGEFPQQIKMIRIAIETLKLASMAIEPRRYMRKK